MTQVQASQGSEVILFLDPMHQIHNSEPDYAWQIKGGQNTHRILTNSGRRRLNIIGALNPLTFIPTIFLTEANCDRQTMMIFLEEVKKDYPEAGEIHIFLDNASYNRAYDTQDKAKELGITLHYLPPYSPNLNLIERLWKFCKKKLVKNKYYPTFDLFFEAQCDLFRDIENYQQELRSLLRLNFEII